MKTVYVVGNSHVMYFIGKHAPINEEYVYQENDIEIKAFKAGDTGATIYGLFNEKSKTQAGKVIPEYLSGKDVENLVVVLGDVDFREHLMKHSDKSPEHFIDQLMERYKQFLKSLKFSQNLILFEMIPFPEEFWKQKIKEDWRNGALWFFKEKFNESIRNLAIHNGWRHLSIWDAIVGQDGYMNREFVIPGDIVHADPQKTLPITIERLRSIIG